VTNVCDILFSEEREHDSGSSETKSSAMKETATTVPTWIRAVLIVSGILMVALGCLALIRARGQLTHIYDDLTRRSVTWSQTTALNYAALIRNVGRQTIHIALGNLLIVAGLWGQALLKKVLAVPLLVLVVIVLLLTMTVLG
jgi:hypothetical protein